MKKLAFLILILFPCVAAAENLTLKYDGLWEGIKAGEVTLKNSEDGDNYNVVTDVTTFGIVKTLTNFYSHTLTTGKIENGQYVPSRYDSKWQTKKGAPHIIVNYTVSGEASETAEPPENRLKRPEVEQVYKQSSIDPVSTILNAREKLRRIVESGQSLPQGFKLKVFDARRVFEANFIIAGYENLMVKGKAQKLLHITLNRSVVAGFTKSELEKIKNFNPTFDIWLDSDYIPVYGTGQAIIGRAEMRLVSMCKGEICG